MERLTLTVWMVGAMLTTGLALVAVSLLQSSERFWHWKQARQTQQGETVPSEGVLRVGQTLTFDCLPKPVTTMASMRPISDPTACDTANAALMMCPQNVQENKRPSGRGVVGRVLEQQRGLLVFALETEEITPSRTSRIVRFTPSVGDTLTLLATGADEMYRFEAQAQTVHADPHAPNRTLVTVKLPSTLTRIQRRQHVRASIQTGATLQTVAAKPNQSDAPCTQPVRCALVDLSGGGLRMEVANAHSPHAIARLHDCLPSGVVVDIDLDLPLLRGSAVRTRIHSCQRVATRGGLALCLRGEFIQLPSWQQEAIVNYVAQA